MTDENQRLFTLLKEHRWEEFKETVRREDHLDLNVRDDHNNYLLTYAILYNRPDVVRVLIDGGARIDITDNEDRSILYIAIRYDYQEIIDLLLEYNRNIVGVFLFDIRDRSNNVPIHYTIIFNNAVALTKLLEAGANPNTPDKNGYNSLHQAIYYRSLRMCTILVRDSAVDVNARVKSGETGLHIACNFQLTDVVKLLVASGINVNIQDYDHEFTALHYCVNLNNKELVSLLLANGAEPNVQDVVGNTVVHYAVSENNLECLALILAKRVNLNLWNFDGKIPLLMALEISANNLAEYIDLLLPTSNVNIQDNEGNTCLHLLCGRELWKEYKPILVRKKLDIFLPNKFGARPVDLVKAQDLEGFLQMTADSYLSRLRGADAYWSEEWENICRKELYYDSITPEERAVLPPDIVDKATKGDLCRVIILKRLRDAQGRTDLKMCSKSFPVKRGALCLDLTEGVPLNVCTFTGSTLDILIGLIYLLKKHPNACSTFSRNFSENKELCKFYKSIGIIMNTRCEFLNFEIVWVHHKLYLVEDFYENFRKCLAKDEIRFVIIPVGIEMREGSHANYILYDKVLRQVERFEPHGANTPPGLLYNPALLDDILETRFREIDPEIKYVRPRDYLPRVGFQLLDMYERKKKKIGDPGGFCALWAIWYIDMRLTYRDIPREVLVEKMIQTIKSQGISFKNLIRNYADNVIRIRDKILERAGLDVNDWLNDQYTDHQIDIVLKELTRDVNALI